MASSNEDDFFSGLGQDRAKLSKLFHDWAREERQAGNLEHADAYERAGRAVERGYHVTVKKPEPTQYELDLAKARLYNNISDSWENVEERSWALGAQHGRRDTAGKALAILRGQDGQYREARDIWADLTALFEEHVK